MFRIKNDVLLKISDDKNRDDITAFLTSHCKNIRHKVIGKSVCFRNIDSFELGNAQKSVLFSGAIHGMEWLTSTVLVNFLYDFSRSKDARVKDFLRDKSIIVIPCVNPDGVEISLHGAKAAKHLEKFIRKISGGCTSSWQANANGVDINHNFDAGWHELKKLETEANIVSPCSTRFGGFSPQSEPETKALVNICKTRNIFRVFAIHSQGEEIYWKYKNTPKESQKIATKLSDVSGYMLSQPEEIASFGGFKDWFIEYCRMPGFTIEMGKGKNPLHLCMFDDVYKKMKELLFLGAVL